MIAMKPARWRRDFFIVAGVLGSVTFGLYYYVPESAWQPSIQETNEYGFFLTLSKSAKAFTSDRRKPPGSMHELQESRYVRKEMTTAFLRTFTKVRIEESTGSDILCTGVIPAQQKCLWLFSHRERIHTYRIIVTKSGDFSIKS